MSDAPALVLVRFRPGALRPIPVDAPWDDGHDGTERHAVPDELTARLPLAHAQCLAAAGHLDILEPAP